ncbi:MAG: efflux RND transporter periplasmic adaptor subunit [Bacillota bacterium]
MKKPNKKKIITMAVICVVVIGATAVYAAWPSGESYAEEIAKVQNLDTYYSYEGNIEAEDSQIIYTTTTSTMKKIYVNEGDTVLKGDLLYELEGDNAESKLTQAQASVTSAKVNYQDAKTSLSRITELYQAGAVSQSEYEQAKSNYEVNQAQLTQAQANYDTAKNDLDDLKGYAEINGEISDIYVEENDMMLSGTEIMDVINYDQLMVKIKIDEFDLDAISEGETADVTITALNKEIPGIVSKISKKAEVVNGVSFFNAEVALEPDPALKVGLSAEIKIHSGNAANAVTISMNALQFDENNRPYVLMEDAGGNIASKYVTVGMNDGKKVEIKEGLQSGDKVMIKDQSSEEKTSSLAPPNPGGRIVNHAAQ